MDGQNYLKLWERMYDETKPPTNYKTIYTHGHDTYQKK